MMSVLLFTSGVESWNCTKMTANGYNTQQMIKIIFYIRHPPQDFRTQRLKKKHTQKTHTQKKSAIPLLSSSLILQEWNINSGLYYMLYEFFLTVSIINGTPYTIIIIPTSGGRDASSNFIQVLFIHCQYNLQRK